MSILGSILSKIFPPSHPAVVAEAIPTTTPMPSPLAAAPAAAPPTLPKAPSVDVESVLTEMAGKNSQTLNWRTSIVDLMKLLGLDSSIANRKKLATELHFTGDMNDSASMNVWLQKQVMTKLAEWRQGARCFEVLRSTRATSDGGT